MGRKSRFALVHALVTGVFAARAVVSNLVIRGCKAPFLENRGEVHNL